MTLAPDQPDLFGEHDAAQQELELQRQPATCPSCGTRELTGWLLHLNHGHRVTVNGIEGVGGAPIGAHPIYGGCTAQYLVTNHIIIAARRGDADQLARDRARGIELGLDVDAIEAEARATV